MNNALIDTDIIIDFLKGHVLAQKFLFNNEKYHFYISAITVAELFSGVRNNQETIAIESLLNSFIIVDTTKTIARIGGLYRQKFGKSHGIGLADAIIAASAESVGAIIVTLNKKHYSMFSNIVIPYTKK